MPNKRVAKSDFIRISNQRVDQLSNLSVSYRPLCRGQRQCDDIWTVRSTSSVLRVSSNPISQRHLSGSQFTLQVATCTLPLEYHVAVYLRQKR